jgi:hypothetical protein
MTRQIYLHILVFPSVNRIKSIISQWVNFLLLLDNLLVPILFIGFSPKNYAQNPANENHCMCVSVSFTQQPGVQSAVE